MANSFFIKSMSMDDIRIYCQSPTCNTKSVGKIRICANLLVFFFSPKKEKLLNFKMHWTGQFRSSFYCSISTEPPLSPFSKFALQKTEVSQKHFRTAKLVSYIKNLAIKKFKSITIFKISPTWQYRIQLATEDRFYRNDYINQEKKDK
jgi:hypothetical protein